MVNSSPTAQFSELERWNKVHNAHLEYSQTATPFYDEALNLVAQRYGDQQSIGKVEIGGLLLWKRLRANTPWAKDLMNSPEDKVRQATGRAFIAAHEKGLSTPQAAQNARNELVGLPGFRSGDALASAILLAAAPERLAVYDSRAHRGLNLLGIRLGYARGRYFRYMQEVEILRSLAADHGYEWSARDVDLALFWFGRPNSQGPS